MFKFLFLSLVALVAAQAPERCDSPSQWHAYYRGFDPKDGHDFSVQGEYYYDKTNLRKARYQVEGTNTSRRVLQVIELFAERKVYEINLESHECHEKPLVRPGELNGFHPSDVPVGATFRGLFYLGSDAAQEAHLECSSWDYEFKDRQYFWHGTFTTHGCVPLRAEIMNRTTFGAIFEEFFDVVPGIPDPNVFVPPSDCKPA